MLKGKQKGRNGKSETAATSNGMNYLKDISRSELKGKRVLVRSDLNVPVGNGTVMNVFRIEKIVPNIQFLLDAGAKVIIASHIGREKEETLRPVANELKKHFPTLIFVQEGVGEHAQTVISGMNEGDAILLENLRRNEGEMKNNDAFAKALASLADIFVNDAFSACHREHASIVGVPKWLPSYAGLLLQEEVAYLSSALTPPSPSLAIIGGAKFKTKEPLIKELAERYDKVFVGGALANDIFAARGLEVGRSRVSERRPSDDVLFHERVIAPTDVVVEDSKGNVRTILPHEVTNDEKIVDVGPDSIRTVAPFIKEAKYILWNGPMGLYEGGFDEWTRALAKKIAESNATTIVGGGDTIAAIQKEGIEDAFTFISTGGGAMLEYLTRGTLPGIEALQ